MEPSVRALPRAVFVLASAFARGERGEALELVQLARGFVIQCIVHWCTGTLLVNGSHAALLYTQLGRQRRRALPGIAAALAAGTLVGLLLVVLANSLLLLPFAAPLLVLGVSWWTVLQLGLAVALVSACWAGTRAAAAYRLEQRRRRAMTSVDDRPTWRLDAVGAIPPGRGHGGRLLAAFVARADVAGATVYLVCEHRNRDFYRAAGFRAVEAPAAGGFDGKLLMRRAAPRPAARRERLLR